jgi:phosphoribosylamine--glycine ligase
VDVLVIGGGGREHALVWKLKQSPHLGRLYCAPGNGGIAQLAELVPLAADDVEGLAAFAAEQKVGLTIVGPELPLTLGLADRFAAENLRVFAPSAEAARLEGSKAFAKELMRDAGVPTAEFEVFDEPAAAHRHVDRVGAPIVVKADGLAAGKGVYVCEATGEAHAAIDEMMVERRFGAAGERVVVEGMLRGEEASFLALTDGSAVLPLATSQDHKRVFDGDAGPNTGGMGAYSPAPVVTPAVERRVLEEVLLPTVGELRKRGIVYRGVLYAGLMIDRGRPSVLEFNVRFGDPECQPLMLRLESDLIEVAEAVIDGRLSELHLAWDPRPAACVVVAAEGYPGSVRKGDAIEGLEAAARLPDTVVFHAGTRRDPSSGAFATDGGRVLGVTAIGETIATAVGRAYSGVERIRFRGMHFRHDIGRRALAEKA